MPGPQDLWLDRPAYVELRERLIQAAPELDGPDQWPGEQFRWLAEAGVLGWVIPREFGGSEVTSAELLEGYTWLAESCLTTTFVLTQRNGACQRIAGSENEALKADLLPRLGTGELFATVGISHLTTSRQHLRRPAVTAVPRANGGYVLTGTVPWVTGAVHADRIVTGGTLDDGRQLLAAVPTAHPGVRCLPPQKLLALGASQTGAVQLDNVEITEGDLVSPPQPEVMKHGSGGGAGSLATSALAIGLSRAALAFLQRERELRPDLEEIVSAFTTETEDLQRELMTAARAAEGFGGTAVPAAVIRTRANSLVLRVTQAALAASKGAGFVVGHPAERWVREAMFFLVWSCPQPVLNAALRELAFLEGEC